MNDEGALGRPTAGTAWEGEGEDGRGDAALPGRMVVPEGVRAVEVRAGVGAGVWGRV